ncbi:hypothetical protein HMPREF9120_01539 [Neisseria sp. oral taxon 020 str. F0370]|nr:hypothetical protein HMPREF9120_01539 [Neisseria sp. oral taxon 020 str. F0370]
MFQTACLVGTHEARNQFSDGVPQRMRPSENGRCGFRVDERRRLKNGAGKTGAARTVSVRHRRVCRRTEPASSCYLVVCLFAVFCAARREPVVLCQNGSAV